MQRFFALRETVFQDPNSFFRHFADAHRRGGAATAERHLGDDQRPQPAREHPADARAGLADPAQGGRPPRVGRPPAQALTTSESAARLAARSSSDIGPRWSSSSPPAVDEQRDGERGRPEGVAQLAVARRRTASNVTPSRSRKPAPSTGSSPMSMPMKRHVGARFADRLERRQLPAARCAPGGPQVDHRRPGHAGQVEREPPAPSSDGGHRRSGSSGAVLVAAAAARGDDERRSGRARRRQRLTARSSRTSTVTTCGPPCSKRQRQVERARRRPAGRRGRRASRGSRAGSRHESPSAGTGSDVELGPSRRRRSSSVVVACSSAAAATAGSTAAPTSRSSSGRRAGSRRRRRSHPAGVGGPRRRRSCTPSAAIDPPHAAAAVAAATRRDRRRAGVTDSTERSATPRRGRR